jgi:hypothetical protein
MIILARSSGVAALKRLIERCVNRLKQFRRIATRYEKTARAFVSMLCIAAARLLDFVLSQYIKQGVEELDQGKLIPQR